MSDVDTSPAALRALAEQMDDVSLIPAKIGDVACDTLRALAAEKEAATVKDGLTVGAEVKPLKAVAVMGVRPPPAQEPSSTVHAPADLRTLAEAATPGPWQVDITRHPYSMVRLDGSFAEGEHVERWIQTVRIDPQAKAPYPIVVRSVGIAHPGEPAITMVHIRPEDADYLAAVSPEVVLGLLDTIDSLRASLAAAQQERDEALRDAIEFTQKVDAGLVRDEEYLRLHREKMEQYDRRVAAEARAEKAEADLKYVNEARALDLADHQTKIKEMAERIRKAEAERDAARWQPIETAPRDGTTIWCYWPGIYGRQGVGWFVWDEFEEWTTTTVHYGYPTHWMPLPAAPANPEDPAHD